jgi:hypothetical protein
MTTAALDALTKIRALRKYDLPAALLAEKKLLKSLNLADLASVCAALEAAPVAGA